MPNAILRGFLATSEPNLKQLIESRCNTGVNLGKVVLATKVGTEISQGKCDISKKWIASAAEHSLRRLQTDYIDLCQTHWAYLVTPVQETLEAYDILVQAEKVRWIGTSNLSPERLIASLDISKKNNEPFHQTFQPEYNLYARE